MSKFDTNPTRPTFATIAECDRWFLVYLERIARQAAFDAACTQRDHAKFASHTYDSLQAEVDRLFFNLHPDCRV